MTTITISPSIDTESTTVTTPGARDYDVTLAVGDRVEAGDGDEADAGIVQTIHGDQAWVGWDSGVRTLADLSDLRPEAS